MFRAVGAPFRGLRALWRALWHARQSLPYRFERARICAQHSPLRRVGVPCAAGMLYVVSFLYVAADAETESRTHAVLLPCALAALAVLLLGGLAGACIAGARAFGGERAGGTLDALLMLPLTSKDLVLGRLLARSRTQRRLFLVYFASTLAVTALVRLEDYTQPEIDWWWEDLCFTLISFTTLGLFYFSVMALGASLGLLLGLRVRSPGVALTITLAAVLILATGEFFGASYWFTHIIGLSPPPIPRWVIGVLRVLAEPLIFMLGFVASVLVNFIAGAVLVALCVRRFDRWATDK